MVSSWETDRDETMTLLNNVRKCGQAGSIPAPEVLGP